MALSKTGHTGAVSNEPRTAFSVRLPTKLHDRLVKEAASKHRSLNGQMQTILEGRYGD